MFLKKVFYKLYLKLIFFSLIFFLSTGNLALSAVLTEEEIRYIESQSKDSEKKEDEYIKYKDIKEKKEKKTPFNPFGISKKNKKKQIKKEPFVEKKKFLRSLK